MSIYTRLRDRDLTQYTTAQLQAGKAYILTSQAGMSPSEGQVIVFFVASGPNGVVVVNMLNGYASPLEQMDQTLSWYEADLDIVIDINPRQGAEGSIDGTSRAVLNTFNVEVGAGVDLKEVAEAVRRATAGEASGGGKVGIGQSLDEYVYELGKLTVASVKSQFASQPDGELEQVAKCTGSPGWVVELAKDELKRRRG